MPARARKPSPADPDAFDGDPDMDDPALADPDAVGPTPPPEEDDELEETDEDIDLTQVDQHDDPEREYVVLTDLIVVATGKEPHNTVRLARGQVVKFSAQTRKFTDVKEFARNKAIAENDGETKLRTDAAAMVRASGAADDPVPVPTAKFVKEQDEIEPKKTAKTA